MIDKLIEIGRCYGIKLNVEKTKVMRISRQPLPVKIIIDQKQLENVEPFKHLGSILTNDGRCTYEIKCRIAKKRDLFTSTLDLELRKKLVKCYIWSIALYGAETWTLRAVDQKHLESSEMWCWRRMEKISWTDHVRNEESRSRGISYMKYVNGRQTGLVTFCVETAFYNGLLKER